MAKIESFSIKPKKKWRKPVIIAISIVVGVLAVIYIIGLTVGRGAERHERISSAVSENTQLRQEISEKDAEIERLQSEMDALRAQLDSMPTPAPVPEPAAEEAQDYGQEEIYGDYLSPREGFETE